MPQPRSHPPAQTRAPEPVPTRFQMIPHCEIPRIYTVGTLQGGWVPYREECRHGFRNKHEPPAVCPLYTECVPYREGCRIVSLDRGEPHLLKLAGVRCRSYTATPPCEKDTHCMCMTYLTQPPLPVRKIHTACV